jgi:hypothetical protein
MKEFTLKLVLATTLLGSFASFAADAPISTTPDSNTPAPISAVPADDNSATDASDTSKDGGKK